ncbi:MAG: pyridoxamine 5'-phosphate oxidase family protein [Beduini sp.]|uniref:pyridoxamine 5'-phosphate oxidase family protein n=1 Tax=Beduini sp. TaxID=1922300 RepID=UPI0039A3065B
MNRYEEGLKLIEESCGNGKDNVIGLATVALELNSDGKPRPCIRDVDAYYENGVFYVSTWGKSNKMQQIAQNNEVAFAVNFEGISGKGIGGNLGWVLDPKNADIRMKLRKAFSDWYDDANDEKNENCVILAIYITQAVIFRDHGAVYYHLDLVNKKEIQDTN